MKLAILTLLGLIGLNAAAFGQLINGGFELPDIPAGTYNNNLTTVPGWSTTDSTGRIELWEDFQGVTAYQGAQFAEINAHENSRLYQNVTIGEAGLVDYAFAHRGRAGVDTLRVDITFAGGDSTFGTSDDVILVDGNLSSNQYSTGTDGWVYYTVNDAFSSVVGGLYRFSFGAVSTATGDISVGNFLDAVSFGVTPVPEASGAMLISIAGVVAILRRRRLIRA
ncbi:MAG: PEP-CTERM sorting domain-containing protein [Verrucomicrobium sp.]|nr:hypothetical protein [Verrucomicrobium sp.]